MTTSPSDGRASRRRVLAAAAAALLAVRTSRAAGTPIVACASDLQYAIGELAAQFERDGGPRLRLVFGSSGLLYAQITQGAPFDLFLSADEAFVQRLAEAGRTDDAGRLYALGRIGLLVPAGSPLEADASLRDLRAAIADGRLKRLAIGNPAHAPYGQRAEEALRHAGLWDAVQPHLVLGENISQAVQFTLSGAAQAGIVAASLAQAGAAARARFALITSAWHRPLRQRMVLMRGAQPGARAFMARIASPPGQAVLQRHGFEPAPG